MMFLFTEFQNTPLHIAVKDKKIEIIKLLLDHKGTKVDIKDKIFFIKFIKFTFIFSWYFWKFIENPS